MLRKTRYSAIFLLAMSNAAFCSGGYIGAGFGPNFAEIQKDSYLSSVPSVTSNDVVDKTQQSGWGMFGTIFGGYAWTHNHFYLAGELNTDISSLDFQSSNLNLTHATYSSTSYEMNRSCGISVLPGLLLSDKTLLYSRFGYDNGNFRLLTTDSSLANVNKNLNGFRFGAGIKQFISKKTALRLEYSQANYQNFTMHVIDPPIVKDTTIEPEVAQVAFALIYDFA